MKLNKWFTILSFQIAVNIIGLPVYHELFIPTTRKVEQKKFHK